MKLIRTTILALSLMLLEGCANTSVYVLNQAEVVRVKKDQAITTKYDGWLLSDRAVNRVMNAKIKTTNLE